MKKILLLVMCCPLMLAAQNGNGVTVNGLDVKPGTVTFNVSWNDNQPEDFLWSDSVWVFVDYNNGAGKMERMLLSGATLTAPSWPDATVIFGKDGNYQGAWVVGNARSAGSFSAKVHLHTATADLHGVCAYASNYPPMAEYTSEYEIKFTGTPMYHIVLKHASGSTVTRKSDSLFSVPASYTVQSFTDATGASGYVPVLTPPSAASTLTYTFGNSTLTWSDRIRATPEPCQLVAADQSSGANAEYIIHTCNGQPSYYYSYACLVASSQELCPAPWRWPSESDYASIVKLTPAQLSLPTVCPAGYYERRWYANNGEWTSTPYGGWSYWCDIEADGDVVSFSTGFRIAYMTIRCVQ